MSFQMGLASAADLQRDDQLAILSAHPKAQTSTLPVAGFVTPTSKENAPTAARAFPRDSRVLGLRSTTPRRWQDNSPRVDDSGSVRSIRDLFRCNRCAGSHGAVQFISSQGNLL